MSKEQDCIQWVKEVNQRFNQMTTLAMLLFVQNSGRISDELPASELAVMSFHNAACFLEVLDDKQLAHDHMVTEAIEATADDISGGL